MSKAIFWIATEDYITEADQSALSVKQCMPDVERILLLSDNRYSDPDFYNSLPDRLTGFDVVSALTVRSNKPYFQDFVWWLNQSLDILEKYEKLLYLDTDIYMAHPVYEMFDLLDKFDLASTHAPARIIFDTQSEVPECFTELNTGVTAFRNNSDIRQLFHRWLELYTDDYENDQTPLRQALWELGTKHYVMSPEYNLRFNSGAQVTGLVKLFHGRHKNLKQLVNKINSSKKIRVVDRNGIIAVNK